MNTRLSLSGQFHVSVVGQRIGRVPKDTSVAIAVTKMSVTTNMGLNEMGLQRFTSVCLCTPDEEVSVFKDKAKMDIPNPDPARFKIMKARVVKDHVVMMVRYPDCTNYEGKKILFFRNTSLKDVVDATRLDPHFCPEDHLSPFARFEPTNDGWAAAIKMAATL
jgi:hypothetical protein